MPRPDPLDTALALALLERAMQTYENSELACAALFETLVAHRVPVDRGFVSFDVTHPLLVVGLLQWTPEDGARFDGMTRDVAADRRQEYLDSPIYPLREGLAHCVRVQLTDPAEAGRFAVSASLAERGFTDYVGLPIQVEGKRSAVVAFATRARGGFDGAAMRSLETAAWAFRPVILQRRWQSMAMILARTYIGPSTGLRVIEGALQRGDVARRDAVVWFSDLRDFTRLSMTLEPAALVAQVNTVFEVTGRHVEAAGGEILKFIGDAVLAFFPYEDEAAAADACLRATQAARACVADTTLRESGLRLGVGLHRGEMAYGNVGTPTRLDFTVLGRVVNVASRVESLCKEIDAPVLATALVARHAEGLWLSRGTRTVRGIEHPIEVFSLA